MIKVSVLYPNGVGAKFDIDYYCTQHMPMVQEKCGSPLKGVGVEQASAPTHPVLLRSFSPAFSRGRESPGIAS